MSILAGLRELLVHVRLRSRLTPYKVTPRANPRAFRRRLLYEVLVELKSAPYEQQ